MQPVIITTVLKAMAVSHLQHVITHWVSEISRTNFGYHVPKGHENKANDMV